MGLLNQILGSIAGNVMGGSAFGRSSGGGNSRVIAALLPVVLGMLANRQGGNALGRGAANLGGNADFGNVPGMGGLGGLLERFSQKGYGQQAQSWVSTGPNDPLPPEAVSDVLGDSGLSQIASQAGLSEDEARTGLSQLLPEVVDHFTPAGQLPDQNELADSVDAFVQQLPR